ncbi:MAG: hypothetical protein GW939_02815 [Candidatus Magasanikbacteria bacterium]|nr:hypothetical protein [Candidatus Magasanikbacteria bacterium]
MNQKKLITILGIAVVILLGTTIYFATFSTVSQPAPATVAQQPVTTQPEQNNTVNTVPSDWKTYSDQKYGYQFQYPNDWNLAEVNDEPNSYNVTIEKDDKDNKDTIQIVKVIYGTNTDGTVNNRKSYLKMLANSDNSTMSITGGQEYYSVNETKGGPSPTVYVVGDTEIFLMNFNIFDSKKTPLTEAEKLFKQIIETFKFTK